MRKHPTNSCRTILAVGLIATILASVLVTHHETTLGEKAAVQMATSH